MRATSNSTLCCHWCGAPLWFASSITYLNGSLPVCDLCLMKAKTKEYSSAEKAILAGKEKG